MTTQTTINFTELIEGVLLATAEQYGRVSIAGGAENLIAAKVGELCPHSIAGEECPDCPTIGQMLREWQALTAIAERAWHSPACPKSAYEGRLLPCTCGLDAARAALQAVRS